MTITSAGTRGSVCQETRSDGSPPVVERLTGRRWHRDMSGTSGRSQSAPRILPMDAVRAVGRFTPDGPTGYRARPPYAIDAPIRATRAEAYNDIEED